MSGWHTADKGWELEGGEFPAVNIITGPGSLPSDKIPSPKRSRNVVEAHFKSLRCFRRWCRYMPFVVHKYGMRAQVTPEQAKLNLAILFRQQNKVRDVEVIDESVTKMYERLYNIQNGDVWGGAVLDFIAPPYRENISN